MTRSEIILAAIIGVALLGIWIPTLQVGYLITDDYLNLRVGASGWSGLWADYIRYGLPYVGVRPLSSALYIVGMKTWGTGSSGFRALLLAVHVAGGWAVFRLAARLGARRTAAWMGTGLFLLTAANSQTLIWISCLPYAAGLALALWALDRHEAGRRGWAAALYAASLLCFPYLLSWPLLVAAGDAVRGRRDWRAWTGYVLVGLGWWALQAMASPGRSVSGFPHAVGPGAWMSVIRNLLILPSLVLAPLPSAGWVWSWRTGAWPSPAGLASGAVALGLAVLAALGLWRAWRIAPGGRVAAAWVVLAVAPMAGRILLDSRHLYAAAAFAGILAAVLLAGRRAQPPLWTASLAVWAAVQAGACWAETARYRDGARVAHALLNQARVLCATLPPGSRVVFEGLPEWEGIHLFNSRDLEYALAWICPEKDIHARMGAGRPGERVIRYEAARGRLVLER